MSDEIRLDLSTIKGGYKHIKKFFENKRNVWVLTLILLLVIVSFSSWVRVQNLELLKDSTTGEYIPVALDPFYFLRLAETIVSQGGLPETDVMRYHPSMEVKFTNEILPQAIVWMYKIMSTFDSKITIQYVDVISPVVFFFLGIISFFFLTYVLTNSKLAALVSAGFLSIMPPYLYRTMAGFSDHESIGIFSFFVVLLCYSWAMKKIEKDPKKDFKKMLGFGISVGFLSAFSIASWGGVANLVFMIIPISFALFWLLNTTKENSKEESASLLVFYGSWFISSVLSLLIYGFTFYESLQRITITSTSFISGTVLLFVVLDYANLKFGISKKILLFRDSENKKYRVIQSFVATIIFGFIILLISGNIGFLYDVLGRFLDPFGASRVGLTVAENAQPFLNDWISQVGKRLFWLFLTGVIFLGFEMSKGISRKKDKGIFVALWTLMIFGILFSRISSSSILSGNNFLSKLFYFGSVTLFLGYLIWVYFKDKVTLRSEYLVLFPWIILMLVATRSAIRAFFIVTPMAALMAGFGLHKLFEYARKTKDDLIKFMLVLISISVVIALLFSVTIFTNTIMIQGKNTGPSAHQQWQEAMQWVRENTPQDAIFAHWWDYGYWVEYLGKRPAIADGGHFQGGFRTHMIGRYLLTSPVPEAALSFMKSNKISYLLIDPTDLGKYPAYSKIGSDAGGEDRYAQIPVMAYSQEQSRTNGSVETRVYPGGALVDEDIIYNSNGNQIFIPKGKAFIGGIIIEIMKNGDSFSFGQPQGIFVYNGQQFAIPLRYIYVDRQLIDFENGIDSAARIIPGVIRNGQNIQVDGAGAVIYLSPMVKNSLFAQLYLLDDAFKNYPTVQIAHSQTDPLVGSLNAQGANINEFVYFNGFRGPIKIWKVEYPENILFNEEFTRNSGEYAQFDGLKFVSD